MAPEHRAKRTLTFVLALSVALLLGSLAFQTMSRSSDSAGKVELRAVQAAVITMMVDNKIKVLPNPVLEPTQDMGGFPDFVTAPEEKGLGGGDKPGYVLHGHDMVADGTAAGTVDYVGNPATKWSYTVAPGGMVFQGP